MYISIYIYIYICVYDCVCMYMYLHICTYSFNMFYHVLINITCLILSKYIDKNCGPKTNPYKSQASRYSCTVECAGMALRAAMAPLEI